MTLKNSEFDQISTKELEVAKYLDIVGGVRLPHRDVEITLDDILELSKIKEGMQVFDSVRNKQDEKTPLCKDYCIVYFYSWAF